VSGNKTEGDRRANRSGGVQVPISKYQIWFILKANSGDNIADFQVQQLKLISMSNSAK